MQRRRRVVKDGRRGWEPEENLTYVVTQATDLNRLERGLVMYEIGYTDRPHITAGFVFITPFPERLRGQVDPHELWDYREVDGSHFPMYRRSMKGSDQRKWDDRVFGMQQAITRWGNANA